MIIYTPLSMDEVFPQTEGIDCHYVETDNGVVMLEKSGDGQWVVGRLLSTEPNDFLQPKYQPGMPWDLKDDQQ
ncbi:hypothetical protein JCM19037_200 [Geomicrobium sp. JCM 19037]|uniref:YlzJ-like family protein n=1 Tax=unclassified Geomicrobium TaxID=2628951 RepID=UPI00045F2813|nr:YlzJ-like family protein [Geomicrobium sp. JCM 19037]GAK02000.1 hypothetical protein JCM19037_200 [Geomicrobium sp. JCM 19037]